MATFPTLEPATRSYDFGQFPLTEEPSVSAGIVRFRHSITTQNYQLSLGYVNLTDAEANLIRTHFQGQAGSYRSFQLPPIIWQGHSFSGNVAPTNTLWRYTAAPEEDHRSAGYVNLTVSLGSDGTVDAELGLQNQSVSFIFAGGAAGGGSGGAALTATSTIAGGAATGA